MLLMKFNLIKINLIHHLGNKIIPCLTLETYKNLGESKINPSSHKPHITILSTPNRVNPTTNTTSKEAQF